MTRIIDWHRFRWRRLGARLALFLFALVLAMPVPGLHARAREGRDARGLAGWWVAIDETFAKLARRGDMRPAEEVLIVNADGRVEDRVMNFWSGAADICARAKVCGDLPAIADARLRLKGDMLSFAGVRARRERVEAARGDKAIRAVALTATAAWTMTRAGDTLTLRAKGATRVLARVEPGRLRRLRAAMLVSGLDAGRHWRCFLANATARDKAFAALGDGTRAAPAFLDSYLRAASYVATIDALSRQPTPDDPDAATRALIGHDSERLMVEDFEGLRLPASLGDKRRLMEIAAWIEHRLRPMPAAQGQPERARPPRVPLNDAELAALARDVNADAEMKQLFCVP